MTWEPVIGLEVHVELNTKTKMFCRCSADYFGKKPNTHTCPVCLGLPGSLPYINKEAINKCIQIGLALNCQISPTSLFERKNYFYPDLPKGYQISQYRWPLCISGKLKIENGKLIRINRVHQEEDTGKLTHQGGETLIDFNRSGVPLVEIVTEPDFTDTTQIKDYAKKLQQMFRYLSVSNAEMERGDMRLEANVSVRPVGQKNLPSYRIELKNINSFRFMVQAVEYEIRRQIEVLGKGEKLTQETRGWDEDKKCTNLQRSKEEAHDYRYFPEPDLPEIRFQMSDVRKLKEELPELSWDRKKRYVDGYGIKEADAQILSESRELAEFFETVVEHGKRHGVEAKEIANYIVNKKPDVTSVLPAQIIEEIKGKKAGVIGDLEELGKIAREVIKESPNLVETYKKGKTTVIMAMVGLVMRKTAGKADAVKVKEILEKLLNFPS